MLATLRRRNFTLLWCAGLISLIGDRAMMTALPFYVYQQTSSTLATAALFTAAYLPMVLLGSVAGVFVDRWDRKRIMVLTNLIQTVVMLLLLLVRSGAGFGWFVSWLLSRHPSRCSSVRQRGPCFRVSSGRTIWCRPTPWPG